MTAESIRPNPKQEQPLFNDDTDPLYKLVLTPEARARTINHPRRLIQETDPPTAQYFWEKYSPSEILVEQLVPNFSRLSEKELAYLTPDASWYDMQAVDEKTHSDSIHGRMHSLRVALYARLLAEKEHLSASDIKILDTASLVHDLGRRKDTDDSDHGLRSADWLEINEDLLKTHGIELNDHEREMVRMLCIYHEVPYEFVDIQNTFGSSGILLRVFKAADALDRFRSPNELWWPDVRFARDPQIHDFIEEFMPFAMHFTLATEYYRTHYDPDVAHSSSVIGRNVGLVERNPEELYPRRSLIAA